jgi:lipopolysaccharide/colanic/teichoic acid biosynthesis glycosyltransferase
VPREAASRQLDTPSHNVSCLAKAINLNRIDRIIIANGSLSKNDFDECVQISHRMGVTVSHALATTPNGIRLVVRTDYGMPLVDIRGPSFTRQGEIVKQAIDFLVGLITLTLVSPVMLVCVLLIKCTSRGPVLFKSLRVGKGGRYFTFFKFRSMYVTGADRQALAARNEQSGHLFKIRRDPRVTPIGRILRRFSLDELPQLLNVLRGDMSLVGPRPLPVEDLDPDGQSLKFTHWAQLRSSVKPGITGVWQTKGRSSLSFEEMIALDSSYIQDWSLGLDLRILLVTPVAVITGKGAY